MINNPFDTIIDRYLHASVEFGRVLRAVGPDQWSASTPCAEWDVRQLVNHVARGNRNYVGLLAGGSAEDFLRQRDTDALGEDPVTAYAQSVRDCATAFGRSGALDLLLDYPLGKVVARQALAVRTTDTVIHTWDLARAIGADDTLDAELVSWVTEHLAEIYADLAETPIAPDSTHRFFAAPDGTPDAEASAQARLLHLMGRNPES